MATVNPTVVSLGEGSVREYTYALTTANADGAPFEMPEWADVTWTAVASNWGGATLKFQGSHNGTTWGNPIVGLSNAAGGTEGTIAADKSMTTIERPRFIRPILTTAGVAAVVTVVALARRAQPIRL